MSPNVTHLFQCHPCHTMSPMGVMGDFWKLGWQVTLGDMGGPQILVVSPPLVYLFFQQMNDHLYRSVTCFQQMICIILFIFDWRIYRRLLLVPVTFFKFFLYHIMKKCVMSMYSEYYSNERLKVGNNSNFRFLQILVLKLFLYFSNLQTFRSKFCQKVLCGISFCCIWIFAHPRRSLVWASNPISLFIYLFIYFSVYHTLRRLWLVEKLLLQLCRNDQNTMIIPLGSLTSGI